MTTSFLTVFNNHFIEFINDVQMVFPEDVELLTAKNALTAARKANPKLIVKLWKQFIGGPYRQEIENGDITFFIEKDYKNDLANNQNSDKIMATIDRLRDPVKRMGEENQAKVLKYLQNLTKLSLLIPTD